MSFIRTGSSPEKLYIFGSKDGIEIMGQHGRLNQRVSYEDWNGLMRKYEEDDSLVGEDGLTDGETFVYGSLTLTSEWVEDEDGKNYKVVLRSSEGWELSMWEVTWSYIYNNWR
jgi:hypothetical protein